MWHTLCILEYLVNADNKVMYWRRRITHCTDVTMFLRQQSIRAYSRLQNACVEETLHAWENRERRVTDVHSICIAMFENKKKNCSRTTLKLNKKQNFVMGFQIEYSFLNCDLGFNECSIPMWMCFAKTVNFKNQLLLIFELFNLKIDFWIIKFVFFV